MLIKSRGLHLTKKKNYLFLETNWFMIFISTKLVIDMILNKHNSIFEMWPKAKLNM